LLKLGLSGHAQVTQDQSLVNTTFAVPPLVNYPSAPYALAPGVQVSAPNNATLYSATMQVPAPCPPRHPRNVWCASRKESAGVHPQ
jgi:hypothetical protein